MQNIYIGPRPINLAADAVARKAFATCTVLALAVCIVC